MFSKPWRGAPSHTTVVAYLSLFLVLTGGTAVALTGSNTVFSDDITNNEVRTADVRDDTLRGGGLASRDVRPNALTGSDVSALTGGDVNDNSLTGSDVSALTGADVNDNSLTGADVNESSLGKVPDADKLDGKDSSAFASSAKVHSSGLVGVDTNPPTPPTLASNETFTISGRCELVGATQSALVRIDSSADGSMVGFGSSQSSLTPFNSPGMGTFLVFESTASGEQNKLKRADFSAVAPNGDSLQGEAVAGVNYGGQDCVFAVDALG